MNYRVTSKSGDIAAEMSKDSIDRQIKNQYQGIDFWFTDYVYDESGVMCGLKGMADLGHGYGFDFENKEFTIKFGETYSFTRELTSIDGPSDWSDDEYKVVLTLEKLKD